MNATALTTLMQPQMSRNNYSNLHDTQTPVTWRQSQLGWTAEANRNGGFWTLRSSQRWGWGDVFSSPPNSGSASSVPGQFVPSSAGNHRLSIHSSSSPASGSLT